MQYAGQPAHQQLLEHNRAVRRRSDRLRAAAAYPCGCTAAAARGINQQGVKVSRFDVIRAMNNELPAGRTSDTIVKVDWRWRCLIAARRKFSREFKVEVANLVWDVGRRFAWRFRIVSVSPGDYRIAFPFAFPFLPAKSDILRFRVRHRRSVSL